MLLLVGTGVNNDITIGALEELKRCEKVYAEVYTNPMIREFLPQLEKMIGKRITELQRDKVESSFLITEAINKRIALVVGGDPLTATTHIVFVSECRKRNIPVKVIHNSSIYSVAPARAGLQIYRFGKTATLVNPRENYNPTSSLDIIRENLSRNLHTLVLLDTEPQPMKIEIALEKLSEFERAVVLSRVASEDETITYGNIKELLKHAKDLGEPPFTIIIPAKLHIVEEEYLEWYKLKKEEKNE